MNYAGHERPERRYLSQFAGYPIYFFDTNALMQIVRSRAERSEAALAAAITTALNAVLTTRDIRIGGEGGFHLVFTSRTPGFAADRARAIFRAIVDALALSRFTAEEADRSCRPVSVSDVAASLGLARESDAALAGSNSARFSSDGDEFSDELGTLFVERLLSSADDNESVPYSPIWDCRKSRIGAFGLGMGASKRTIEKPLAAPDALAVAVAQSKLDIAVLAWAVGATRRLLSLDKIALVSVPLHVETLSWSKTRNAYLDVLGLIDPRLLSLIAPRIVGFDAGSNLGQVTQWTQGLRRHVRGVFVHLPSTNFDFSNTGSLGAKGFGLTAHTNRATLGEEAGRLARICDDQNAVAYIDNVISTAELSILKRKGVRFVSGPLIGVPATLTECVRAPSWEKTQLAASA